MLCLLQQRMNNYFSNLTSPLHWGVVCITCASIASKKVPATYSLIAYTLKWIFFFAITLRRVNNPLEVRLKHLNIATL